ncbi:MAG: hypothetical protein AAGG72_09125, partial [Pseudomonadota bacterium]
VVKQPFVGTFGPTLNHVVLQALFRSDHKPKRYGFSTYVRNNGFCPMCPAQNAATPKLLEEFINLRRSASIVNETYH